jgi:hypothetical protein
MSHFDELSVTHKCVILSLSKDDVYLNKDVTFRHAQCDNKHEIQIYLE